MIESMTNNDPFAAIDDAEGHCKALCSDDHDVRVRAIKDMEKLGDRPSIRLLVGALKSEHYDVRESAYHALRKLGCKAMPDLARALKDESFYARMYATLAITDQVISNPDRKYGDDVIDALTHALLDKSIYVRRSAYDALKVIEYNKVLKALIISLSDPDYGIRLEAVIALGRIADRRSVKALILALSGGDIAIKKYAAAALGYIGDKKAARPLMELLRDPDGGVRKEAAKALGAIGDETAVPSLLRMIKDSEPSVRAEALDALSRYRSFRYVAPLVEALGDDAEVRAAAARALGKVKGTKAVAPLIGLLADHDPKVRESAQVALVETGSCAVKSLRAAMNGDSDLVRCGASRVLELMSKAKARKRIERSHRFQSPEVWCEIEAAISACSKERQSDLASFNI